eukprot:TRINITY_DN62028_c0_g1_i1.p2 TRINITY_DN62028_c0_g1~~TRINITY_DN62028_c0_g1_i1.p2  ORF type:complete len:126 (+),score=7.55 TRINITY_DN62028_c0_g1_i1:385-762(+)
MHSASFNLRAAVMAVSVQTAIEAGVIPPTAVTDCHIGRPSGIFFVGNCNRGCRIFIVVVVVVILVVIIFSSSSSSWCLITPMASLTPLPPLSSSSLHVQLCLQQHLLRVQRCVPVPVQLCLDGAK